MKKRLRGLLALCIIACMAFAGTTGIASAATNWAIGDNAVSGTQTLFAGDTIKKGDGSGGFRIFIKDKVVSPANETDMPGYSDGDAKEKVSGIFFNGSSISYTVPGNTLGYNGWEGTASKSKFFTQSGEIHGYDVTLKEIPISYTLIYNVNGGTGSVDNAQFDVDGAYGFSNGNGLTKDGMTVKCWNTKADGSGTNYALGSIIPNTIIQYAKEDTTPGSDIPYSITLYAQYEKSDASPATGDPMNIGFITLMLLGAAGVGMAAMRKRLSEK